MLQLREEIQVWVLDHTAAAIQYSIFEKKLSEGYTTNLMLPGYSAVSRRYSLGLRVSTSVDGEVSTLCTYVHTYIQHDVWMGDGPLWT